MNDQARTDDPTRRSSWAPRPRCRRKPAGIEAGPHVDSSCLRAGKGPCARFLSLSCRWACSYGPARPGGRCRSSRSVSRRSAPFLFQLDAGVTPAVRVPPCSCKGKDLAGDAASRSVRVYAHPAEARRRMAMPHRVRGPIVFARGHPSMTRERGSPGSEWLDLSWGSGVCGRLQGDPRHSQAEKGFVLALKLKGVWRSLAPFPSKFGHLR